MLRTCRCCGEPFTPSPYQVKQKFCSKEDCQRQRKNRYHLKRYRNDSDYRDDCRRSRKKWRDQNPDYHREYRKNHPEQVQQNREKQKPRDQLRQLRQQALQQKAALHLQTVPTTPPSDNPAILPIPFFPQFDRWAWIGLISNEAKASLDKNNLAPP